MPKRSRSKPSRSRRKEQRRKSARAAEHGLPNRVLERPSTRSAEPGQREARRQVDAPQTNSDSELTKPRTLSDRLSGVPLAVKLAVVVVVALALIGIFAYSRGRGEVGEQSGQRAASAPLPANLKPPLEVPELRPPEPPAARALPSAERSPTVFAPTTAPLRPAARPPAPTVPSVEPTTKPPQPKTTKAPPTSPPAQTGARDPLEPPSSLSGPTPQPRLPETSPPAPAPPVPTTIPAPTPLRGKLKTPATQDNPY